MRTSLSLDTLLSVEFWVNNTLWRHTLTLLQVQHLKKQKGSLAASGQGTGGGINERIEQQESLINNIGLRLEFHAKKLFRAVLLCSIFTACLEIGRLLGSKDTENTVILTYNYRNNFSILCLHWEMKQVYTYLSHFGVIWTAFVNSQSSAHSEVSASVMYRWSWYFVTF